MSGKSLRPVRRLPGIGMIPVGVGRMKIWIGLLDHPLRSLFQSSNRHDHRITHRAINSTISTALIPFVLIPLVLIWAMMYTLFTHCLYTAVLLDRLHHLRYSRPLRQIGQETAQQYDRFTLHRYQGTKRFLYRPWKLLIAKIIYFLHSAIFSQKGIHCLNTTTRIWTSIQPKEDLLNWA